MKIIISELRQIIIEEVEHEAQLEETYASEVYRDELSAILPSGRHALIAILLAKHT